MKPIERMVMICACASVSLVVAGCGSGLFEIGPVQMTVPLGSGTFSPSDLFGGKSTVIQIDQDIYDLPTEGEVAELVKEMDSSGLSGLLTVTRLELVETELRALAGSFSFVSDITLSYIPKPVNGVAQDPVLIGAASAPGGFGTVIILEPVEGVDLLPFILENDANPAIGSPKVRFEATLIGVPTTQVTWFASVDVDAYASISLAKTE